MIETKLSAVFGFELPDSNNRFIQRKRHNAVFQRDLDRIPCAVFQVDLSMLDRWLDQDVIGGQSTIGVLRRAAIRHPVQLDSLAIKQKRQTIKSRSDVGSRYTRFVPEFVLDPFTILNRTVVMQPTLLHGWFAQT